MTMNYSIRFQWMSLAAVLLQVGTHATMVQGRFKVLSGQNISGEIGAELKTISRMDCAVRLVKNKGVSTASIKEHGVILHLLR